jgi:hypothetical protein
MYTKRTFSVFEKLQTKINLKSINREYLHNQGMQYETFFDSSKRLIKSLDICWNACSTCNYYYYSDDDKIEKIVTIYTSISDEYIVDLFVFEYSKNQISEKKINIENDSLSYGNYEKFNYENLDFINKAFKEKPIQDFKISEISDFNFEKHQPILFSNEIDFKKMVNHNKLELLDKGDFFLEHINKKNDLKAKIGNSGNNQGLLLEQSKLSNPNDKERYGYFKNKLCYIGNLKNNIAIHFEEKSNQWFKIGETKFEIGLKTDLNNFEVRKLFTIKEENVKSLE